MARPAVEQIKIQPQRGPQEQFLSSSADIVIYGGAAGSGKSWGILMEPLRHVPRNPEFAAVFFRRNTTQIRNPGGLWDESIKLYPSAGGSPTAHLLEWNWKNGGKIKFAHLEYESTVLEWQGAQIPLICFDELTHFTETQFFYLMSRNRSMSGVAGYIRATCNPDADSWVATFIAWWIDQDTGYPIAERSGIVRWFIRVKDALFWGDSKDEVIALHGDPDLPLDHEDQVRPKSITFIPALLSDNKKLMEADPNYKSNLMALGIVEQERLLKGNWKIRPSPGLYFPRDKWKFYKILPELEEIIISVDCTFKGGVKNDYVAIQAWGRVGANKYLVDRIRARMGITGTLDAIRQIAAKFPNYLAILVEDKANGPAVIELLQDELPALIAIDPEGGKEARANAVQPEHEAGNLWLPDPTMAPWIKDFIEEHAAFPQASVPDDEVDSMTQAVNWFRKRHGLQFSPAPATAGRRTMYNAY